MTDIDRFNSQVVRDVETIFGDLRNESRDGSEMQRDIRDHLNKLHKAADTLRVLAIVNSALATDPAGFDVESCIEINGTEFEVAEGDNGKRALIERNEIPF